jgi:hypothetical protein
MKVATDLRAVRVPRIYCEGMEEIILLTLAQGIEQRPYGIRNAI